MFVCVCIMVAIIQTVLKHVDLIYASAKKIVINHPHGHVRGYSSHIVCLPICLTDCTRTMH